MVAPSIYRKFDGKRFLYTGGRETKKEAESVAQHYRSSGLKARVVRAPRGFGSKYAIYSRNESTNR